MTAPHLIYFADPMCSWCYGFSPVMEDIRRAFGRALPVRLVMGGLRPGTETPMTQEAKDSLRGHWVHITEATGLPFGGAVLDDPGFLYDTDPAARAVVRVRRDNPEGAIAYLGRLQRAFYAEDRNITRPEVLAELAADYGVSQRAGVTGFPTLVAGPGAEGTYGVVTRGYNPGDQVVAILKAWLEGPPANG